MWFQVELPAPVMLTELQFTASMAGGGDGSPGTSTFPRSYEVRVSSDGTAWSAPVASGRGAPGTTIVTFAPVQAKFVRIIQTDTATGAPPWSMRLLRLYQAPLIATR